MINFFYLILFMMILLWGAVSADEPAGVSSFELAPCLLIRISAKKMFSRAILPCRAVANESHFFIFNLHPLI